MADARQQADWDRTLSLMAYVGAMLSPKPPRPTDLIPPRYRPQMEPRVPLGPDGRERRIRNNWRALDALFGGDTSGG